MTTCQYFGLHTAPFEMQPEPRMYCPTPGHAEVLATMQYAVHAGKPCLVVVGESGTGKTLLGRMICQQVNARHGILWVHGIGQSARQTTLTVCPPGTFSGPGAPRRTAVACTSLAKWLRAPQPPATPSVLIVDNADALPERGWQDVLAIVTREAPTPRPLCVMLLGLPSLMRILSEPDLVRLRRRVFRTCQIGRLSRDQTGQYVRHRMKAAGADPRVEHFTDAAIDLIYRTSAGNPALINQICDNALVEAFADDTVRVDAPQVITTIHAVTGGPAQAPASLLDAPAVRALPLARVPIEYRHAAWVNGVGAHGHPTRPREPSDAPARAGDGTALYVDDSHATAGVGSGTTPRIVSTALANAAISFRPLDDRLRALESRLAEALDRVRTARADRDLTALDAPAAAPTATVECAASSTADTGTRRGTGPEAEGPEAACPAAPKVETDSAAAAAEKDDPPDNGADDRSAPFDRLQIPSRENPPDCETRSETP